MDGLLRALADPTRRAILVLAWGDELTAGDIAARFPLTRPAVSQHLAVLKGAGLLEERRAGTRRYQRASPAPLEEVRAFLDQFRDPRLARLRRLAEQEERRRGSEAASPR